MVPASEHFLSRARDVGNIDKHFAVLADAIHASDALLDQIRVQWQVEHHEVARVLEVASLAADLRAHQHARPVGLDEPCSVAIALHELNVLVEERDGGA